MAPGRKAVALAAVIALHVAVYYAVNAINSARPTSRLLSFHIPVDGWIPYVGWTSIVYYLGDVYILPIAALIVWRLPAGFGRAIRTYAAMVLAGGVIQILLPAQAPFPTELHPLQRFVHRALSVPPYACLPSMHVALTVFPACLAGHAVRSEAVWARTLLAFSAIAATLITVSTVTAKEHYFLDALTGAALAFACYAVWRIGTPGQPAE